MSTTAPIQPGRARGLAWDALLRCSGSAGAKIAPTAPNGDPAGPWQVAAYPSPADPMWAPNKTETCPRCHGTGQEWEGGVDLRDVWAVDCPLCSGAGEVRVPAVYIGELEPSHRRNLYSWLMRRAPAILGYVVHSWWGDPFGMDDGLEHAAEEAERELAADPWGWLAGQSFMLALGALLIGDGNGGTVAAWERRAKLADPEQTRLRVDAAICSVAALDLGLVASHLAGEKVTDDPDWTL